MPLTVPCLKCKHKFQVSSKLAGTAVRCTACGHEVLLPTLKRLGEKRNARAARPVNGRASSTVELPADLVSSADAPPGPTVLDAAPDTAAHDVAPADEPATLACPHCEGLLLHDASLAGQTVACPHCGGHVQMPAARSSVAPRPKPSGPTCSACDAPVDADAEKCPYCGESLAAEAPVIPTPHAPPPLPEVPQRPAKSPGLATLLELAFGLFGVFGIGHFYAGSVFTGLLFMVGYWLLVGINVALCVLWLGLDYVWLATIPYWLLTLVVSPLVASFLVPRRPA